MYYQCKKLGSQKGVMWAGNKMRPFEGVLKEYEIDVGFLLCCGFYAHYGEKLNCPEQRRAFQKPH